MMSKRDMNVEDYIVAGAALTVGAVLAKEGVSALKSGYGKAKTKLKEHKAKKSEKKSKDSKD